MKTEPWSTFSRTFVLAVCLVLLGALAYGLRPLVGPLVFAGLLAYVLNPLARAIRERTRLGRVGSVSLAYFLFLAILIATPGTLIPVLVGQTRTFSVEILAMERQLEAALANPVPVLGRTIHLDQVVTEVLANAAESLTPATENALRVLETTSISLVWLLVILVSTYYFLMDWRRLRDWLIGLAPDSEQPHLLRLWHEIDATWRAYIRGTLALMVIMAVIFIAIGLAIGLPGAVILGLITGMLSMIPEAGPVIAGTLSVAVALFQGSNFLPISNFWFALLVLVINVVVMQIKSLWLRPHVMGRFMHMNTGLVFVAIVAAVVLHGILAALIILPILATLGIVGRYIRRRILNLEPWPDDEPLAQAVLEETTPRAEAPLAATGSVPRPEHAD